MKYLLRILCCLCLRSGVSAQTPIRLDSLLSGRIDLEKGWYWHAGDNPAWASPALDDRQWAPVRTDFLLTDAPPSWRGIGWFRLHIRFDTLPPNHALALGIRQYGACELYVDGRRVGGMGVIGQVSATGTDYVSRQEFIPFSVNQPGEHLLAIRYAATRPYIFRWARYPLGFASWLSTQERLHAERVEGTQIWSLNLLVVSVPIWFALLHLFLFWFYPARRSNLYYSGWLLIFAGTSACVYLDGTLHNPVVLQGLAYAFLLGNTGNALSSVAFVYAICYPVMPRRVWGLTALALLVAGLILFLTPYAETRAYTFGFVFLCLLEVIRVVVVAALRRQPGVWLLGVGLLMVGVAIFIGSGDVLGIWVNRPWGQNLFITLSFLTLPLCTSLYLAQDFGRTSLDLEVRLREVEMLSAQTRAQEADKLALIAGQNEKLEQTVRQRTDQLQRQADQLRDMDQVKSRFFTNLTHEFRTPLTLMLGPAGQILAHTQEPDTRQQAGLLQRNAQRLLQLINQLLDLSRLEAGKLTLTTAPGELVGLARGLVGAFESLAYHGGITLRFETELDQFLMALDQDKVEKIVGNLLSNALKFTPAGGTVVVSLTQADTDWVVLAVRDTGIGIPADKLPYVYDRFYQADASDTRKQEGTGIGLALTKELVELHGGTIQLSSSAGVGTTFMVRLPVGEPPANMVPPDTLPADTLMLGDGAMEVPGADGPDSPEESTLAASPAETPLVLLVEDNDDVRQFIRSVLAGPYWIIEAPNGEEGVRLAQQRIPDLVVTDLMMPKMNGYEVCAALKADERTSHIPVVMLTAKADLDSRVVGLQTGADSYLAKPFDSRELLAQVANLIQSRQQLQAHYQRNQKGLWPAETSTLPSMEQVFLDRVRGAIETNFADEQYNLDRLSDDVGMSRTQLHRKLKALTDQSPGDLLRLARLHRAHELLRANVGTVAEVAYQVGFGNPANFATSFSRQFGYAPSEARKRL